MFAIAGVSGHTGSIVASTLLAQGRPVRVLVRDAAKGEPWRARGAEVAVAALEDTAALTRALTGAAGAYVLIPPRLASTAPLADNRRVADSIARAVGAAKVPHVVLLSSMGAHLPDGTGPIQSVHHAEEVLAATGAALTSVRAGYFMENWAGSLAGVPAGVLPSFLPTELPIPMIATADIARVAAAALVEGGRGRQVIELSGPRDYSAADVAAAVSRLAGKPVTAQPGPLDAVVATYTGYGMTPAFAELFREMYAGIASGRVAWEGGTTRAVRGTVTIEDVLAPLLAK